MKAVVYDKNDSNDKLVLREVEKPIPKDNQVLIKVYAVSLNAADYRSMKMGIIPKNKIFGSDISGKIEAVGKDITKFSIDDEVFGDISACGFGGLAEYVAVSENALTFKPHGISFESAAAVPMSAVTALQALRNKGNIQKGQTVLIYGAGGGVGTFAVQLAKYYDTEVTAVCGERNVDLMRSLKADFVIDYHKDDFSQSNKRYDLVIAVNGNRSLSTYKHVLSTNGIYVNIGGALSQVFKSILFGGLMSIGSKKMRFLAAKPNIEDLKFIIKLVEEGQIIPVVDKLYPFYETSEAMKYISNGHAQGKVIVVFVGDIVKDPL